MPSMANMPLKRGLSQWRATWQDERRAKELLLAAVRGIVNAKARKVYNAWLEMVEEKRELARKLRQAAAQMSPEGRAMKGFLRKLVWIRRRKEAMRRACSGFVFAGCRVALHRMRAQLEQLRKLRRGGNAIRLRKARQCWNQWAEISAAGRASREKMVLAARMMTPEGRMLRHGWSTWRELMEQVQPLGSRGGTSALRSRVGAVRF